MKIISPKLKDIEYPISIAVGINHLYGKSGLLKAFENIGLKVKQSKRFKISFDSVKCNITIIIRRSLRASISQASERVLNLYEESLKVLLVLSMNYLCPYCVLRSRNRYRIT